MHVERMKAFEDLTKALRNAVEAMVDVIELVEDWRKAIEQSAIRSKYPERPPFIWNGRNVLLDLPSAFDFLSHCLPLVCTFSFMQHCSSC